jgi:hypothetical protein
VAEGKVIWPSTGPRNVSTMKKEICKGVRQAKINYEEDLTRNAI